MNYHKYANLFPLIEGEEFDTLVADIMQNGLIEPVWLYDNSIIDGRNRYRACEELGIEADTREYMGDDPLGFVVTLNLMRRHMTPAQRAMLGAELKIEYQEAQGGQGTRTDLTSATSGRSRDKAADAVGVGHAYITMAEKIKEDAPEIVDDVLRGELPLKQAAAIAGVELESRRERILARVKAEKANIDKTKSIIRSETGGGSSSDSSGPANPEISWTTHPRIEAASDGFKAISAAISAMASNPQKRKDAKAILKTWKVYISGFVARIDEILDA